MYNETTEYRINILEEYLRNNHFRMTKQRMDVCKTFFALKEYVTINEIFNKLKQKKINSSKSILYRITSLLCDAHILYRIILDDGIVRYKQISKNKYYDLICKHCGKTIQLNSLSINKEYMTNQYGYKLEEPLDIFGLCPNCQ